MGLESSEQFQPAKTPLYSTLEKLTRNTILATAVLFAAEGNAAPPPREAAEPIIAALKGEPTPVLLEALNDNNYFVRMFATKEIERRTLDHYEKTGRHTEWEDALTAPTNNLEVRARKEIIHNHIIDEQQWLGTEVQKFPPELVGKVISGKECLLALTNATGLLINTNTRIASMQMIVEKDISSMTFYDALQHIRTKGGRALCPENQKGGVISMGIVMRDERTAHDDALFGKISNNGYWATVELTTESFINIASWEVENVEILDGDTVISRPKPIWKSGMSHSSIRLLLPPISKTLQEVTVRVSIHAKGKEQKINSTNYPLDKCQLTDHEAKRMLYITKMKEKKDPRDEHSITIEYDGDECMECEFDYYERERPYRLVAQSAKGEILESVDISENMDWDRVKETSTYKQKPDTATIVLEGGREYDVVKELNFHNVPLKDIPLVPPAPEE